jgi:hypothetical protein
MKGISLIAIMMMTSFVFGSECPMHQEHQNAAMTERGNKAMGFDQNKTTHHFLLKENGGIIQVEANDPKDLQSRDEIRGHLSHIAILFSKGDFEIPMFIHDRMPDGVPVMKELKDEITYNYEETESGGKVNVISENKDAVEAIHEFLRFQIQDHKTGDPLK